MAKSQSVTIHVPATSANLGPAFDCLALALDLWNVVTVSLEDNRRLRINIKGEGEGILSTSKNNLIYQAFSLALERHHFKLPLGLSIHCQNQIPPASGLGSSSSAIIAGLLAADALFGLNMNPQSILALALELESHPDNIAACLIGGLVIVLQENGAFITRKVEIAPLKAVIALPQISLSTKEARAALPQQYSREDVVFNISRTALLIESLASGNFSDLQIAMQDYIHQPYRLGLIPGAEGALKSALDAGALGVSLSGAGPALIAFYLRSPHAIGQAMTSAFNKEHVPVRIFNVSNAQSGAWVS